MQLQEILAKRRSHRSFSGQAIPESELRELLDLAVQAPNHKRNQPWRFYVVMQAEIPKWLERAEAFVAEAYAGIEPAAAQAKWAKLRQGVGQLGAMIVVTSQRDSEELRDRENYAAVACAVENFLLLAVDRGLGTFWSTNRFFQNAGVLRMLGAKPEQERLLGAIWLGEPTDAPESPGFTAFGWTSFWRG